MNTIDIEDLVKFGNKFKLDFLVNLNIIESYYNLLTDVALIMLLVI